VSDDFLYNFCAECTSILDEFEDAWKAAPPLSSVVEDLEEQARRGEPLTFDSKIINASRRMEQHQIRTGHSVASFLRTGLPYRPYFG
jgi:hypothetical protein